jgi:hypothetical protein
MLRSFRALILPAALVALGVVGSAQRPEVYKARLSPLGVTNATVATTTGVGNVTATLNGTTLAIEGSFEGLTGNATAANLRQGPKGIPGPVIKELEVPKASNGKITASVTLTAEQIADLKAERLYLQIHSERAPEGSIRGWLLK